jgi:hypothetical protein
MSTDQQSVGIDTVGGTGKHGTIVLTLADHEAVYLMRLYNEDLIYLIGQDLIQNAEHKQVSLADLVQVGKELGAGQTPVSGNNAVGTLPTYRKAGPLQVTDSDLEDRVLGAVIYRERNTDAGDLNIAHNTVTGNVQELVILLLLFRGSGIAVGTVQETAVIFSRCLQESFVFVLL